MTDAELEKQIAELQAMGPWERVSLRRDSELAPQWQPIETAPKDGTRILLWDGYMMYTGSKGLRTGGWHSNGERVVPTHWQPLPAPPTACDARRP